MTIMQPGKKVPITSQIKGIKQPPWVAITADEFVYYLSFWTEIGTTFDSAESDDNVSITRKVVDNKCTCSSLIVRLHKEKEHIKKTLKGGKRAVINERRLLNQHQRELDDI